MLKPQCSKIVQKNINLLSIQGPDKEKEVGLINGMHGLCIYSTDCEQILLAGISVDTKNT